MTSSRSLMSLTGPFRVSWLRTASIMLMLGAMPCAADEFKPQTPVTTTLPATMNRVYVADAALPHMVDGRVYVLDAADLSLKGMLEAGFAGMFLAAPDKHQVYVATTFYERLTRGKPEADPPHVAPAH